MMRSTALSLVLSIGLASAAMAQTTAPSGTPTTGAVGSAALRNGYPGSGGAVALPTVQNSSLTSPTPAVGTTTSTTTTSTTATSTTATSSTATTSTTSATGTTGTTGGSAGTSTGSATRTGGSGTSGGGSGGGAGRGGSASTAGAATPTGSSNSGSNWVMCPPGGSSGLAPLFTGTDLSCAPQ